MEFSPIFTREDNCNLWAVCYPEYQVDGVNRDIFTILFDEKWSDVEYIREFVKTNLEDLLTPFWAGLSITDAINKIEDERLDLANELYLIETKQPGYENISLSDIFEKLHDCIYSLNTSNESHRKGKPNFEKPILRIYAIELEDGTYVITGGAIKLKDKMIGQNFDKELANLKRVQDFLKINGIINKQGLIEK